MRALVLGASGFIGAWIARALEGEGHEVLRASRDPSAELRFDALHDDPRALVRITRPEVIFNAIGYGVDPAERDEALAVAINTDFVERLARSITTETLIHLGSALEYGSIGGDLSEDSIPHPTTLYGRTKLEGTERLRAIAMQANLRALTARLFTVYGPGEHESRLLPSLIRAITTTDPLPFTSGAQRRDFTYVEDVARALILLASSDFRSGEIVNVASGRLHSVREFIETAVRVLAIPAERIQLGALPQRGEEMSHDDVAIARLRALISPAPDASLEAGILATAKRSGLQIRSF